MIKNDFSLKYNNIIQADHKSIYIFENTKTENIDHSVVKAFGEEWAKFYNFTDDEINQIGLDYFDIVNNDILNKNTSVLDVGCGTGRWSKYIANKVHFVEAIDPSKAIFFADKLLSNVQNVRLSVASTDNIPFADESFDFVMSIGVLHHIPNTQKAMIDCVKKVKIGGYFYVYLYYNLDNKGFFLKTLFKVVDALRKVISALNTTSKKFVCDILAILLYWPIVIIGKVLNSIGFKKFASKLPLSYYQDKSFFVIRNDALDRFGTSLEQRFTKEQVVEMMKKSGLDSIIVSEGEPFWHAIGKRSF
jgi:ubiquinone/menaquinone biosynthesis C-methylase UbiE